MKQFIVISIAVSLLCTFAEAHTQVTNIIINGQQRTRCLRPQYPNNLYHITGMGPQWPVSALDFLSNGVMSANYTCGFLPYAAQPAQEKCDVGAGSQVGISYYHGAGAGEDPVLDRFIHRSHKGPFIVYMAKSDTGAGNVWFKIYEEGKIQVSDTFAENKWASPDSLLANDGVMRFNIPSDLSPGNYLLRTEILALHEGDRFRGAQPYVNCVELRVTGSGTANPPGVAIPGSWDYSDNGLHFNIYNNYRNPYPIPGPDVYQPGTAPESQEGAAGSLKSNIIISALLITLYLFI